jgi:hypothetical protein
MVCYKTRICTGVNVYCWGKEDQNRFLNKCLRPYLLALEQSGRLRQLWYDRCTQRGPHLFILLDVDGKDPACLQFELDKRISQYFRNSVPSTSYSPDELERMCLDAGGKILCRADLLPGYADNCSTAFFLQSESEYPFALFEDGDTDALRKAIRDLCLLTLRQLSENLSNLYTFAVRMALLLDTCIHSCSKESIAYWYYHAGTLISNFDRCIPGAGEIEQLAVMASGKQGLSRLSDGFREMSSQHVAADVRPILTMLREAAPDKIVFRELVHVFFKQLGLTTQQQIGIVFLLLHLRMSGTNE